MNKKKKWIKALSLLLVCCTVVLCAPVEKAYAVARSYSNAKEFFYSTGQSNGKHIDIYNGNIYFATQAKLSSSSSNLRYYTLGFDITLTGNGKRVSFSVKRGGSLASVHSYNDTKAGYNYELYCISTNSIRTLARATKNANVETVLNASKIDVRMDAIMTTLQNGTIHGSITENGSGGINITSNPVYRLKKSSDLATMKNIFSGHEFKSYIEINDELDNCQLDIMYQLGAYTSLGNGYTASSVTIGGQTLSNVLLQSNKVVTDSQKVLQTLTLRNPATMGLKKTGYYLPSGAEWTKGNGVTYSATATYEPKDLHPEAGIKDMGIVLYANWKANPYTIYYDANGGTGAVTPSSMAYDMKAFLRANTFTRTGYRLKKGAEWNTKPDGTGTSYASGAEVLNLTSEYDGKITLYANWVPCVYQITTDKQEGTGGTDNFFEKYGIGFYSDEICTSSITTINVPSRTGYEFQGYFSNIRGAGEPIVDKKGLLLKKPTYFIKNTTVFANWLAKQFTITFDKQGGTGGTDSVIATYNKLLPSAEAPIRTGYTFEGYYFANAFEDVDKKYYTQYMVPTTVFLFEKNISLSAKWVDDILPTASITVSTSSWTNMDGGIEVETFAFDLGSGLSKVELYCEDTLVDSKTGLNGTNDVVTIRYRHLLEGAYRYKVVAYDMEGNVTESYESCLYDITDPSGDYTLENDDVTNFKINVDASDYNIP